MKSKILKNIFISLSIFLTLILGISFSCLQTSFAEVSPIESVDEIYHPITLSNNGNFSMKVNVDSRLQNVDLPQDVRLISPYAGKDVEFYCFKWRDIEKIDFEISSNVSANDKESYNGIHFKLTYLKTDEKMNPIGVEKIEKLYDYTITSNSLSTFDFLYYIDSDSKATLTEKTKKGYGFGLYQFELSYDFYDPLTMKDNNSTEICEATFYLAVVPDLIEEIEIPTDLKISYTVSSSNRLMNNYLFRISSDAFKYVNPAYLEWEVTGMGKNKQNYCRDYVMKNSDIVTYANYDVIKPSYQDYHGDDFLLDTNDIEGTWTATLVIRDSEGNVILRLSSEQVSTIKSERHNLLWLIWLLLAILLLLAIIIVIIIISRNKTSDEVW